MTIKELLERMNDTTRPDEELLGLKLFNIYVQKLETATVIEDMSNAKNILYGMLLGMKMTNYINEKEFEELNNERIRLSEDFLKRRHNK